MTQDSSTFDEKLSDFLVEISGFAKRAEETLKIIESDLLGNKQLLSRYSEDMFTIRSTSEQLGLDRIVKLARLAEELGFRGAQATERPQIRRCVGALWDAMTTIKYILENYSSTDLDKHKEEQQILENRLENNLKLLGGARETLSPDEILKLIGS